MVGGELEKDKNGSAAIPQNRLGLEKGSLHPCAGELTQFLLKRGIGKAH